MLKHMMLAAAAVAMIGLAGCDWGGGSSRDTSARTPTPAPAGSPRVDAQAATDTDLLRRAASGGMAEVQLSELALESTQSAPVRDFARHMVQEHTAANADLRALARAKDVDLPTELAPEHLALRERLVRSRGAEFDREYMTAMIEDHRTAINIYQRLSREARDADVRSFAAQTLPILEMHLEEAQSIQQQIASAPWGEDDQGFR